MFHEQVAIRPGADALECGGETLSYSGLSALSYRIAENLRGNGVAAGDLVALCLDRTAHFPAAVLGILTCGAAYLAIDPLLPEERIRFMISDAGCALAIVETAFLEWFDCLQRAVSIHDLLAQPPSGNCDLFASSPDNLAYVVYTSGSTGQPKGVEIVHRGLSNLLECMRDQLQVAPGSRVLAQSSFSFDISVLQILLPLASGATVILIPESKAEHGDALRAILESSRISLMFATPTGWRLLRNAGWQGDRGLTAVSGGERLSASLGQWLWSSTKAAWNQFGPSETTVVATSHRLSGGESHYPIGHVLPGLFAEIGESGELLIGGMGLARGYRNRPVLNKERFIDRGSMRLYRTGDLVRRQADGAFEFVGRTDNQVKVNGFRVELEEIEAALCRHPEIDQCASVVLVESTDANPVIVALFVPVSEAIDPRSFARRWLPHYMVPNVFVPVDRLPVNTNGKVDRSLLPSLAKKHLSRLPASSADSGGLAKNPVEAELISIWRRALGRPNVGRNDRFFDLGGTSVTAAAVVAHIRRRFSCHLPLATFLAAPTIAAMADLITRADWKPYWSPLVPISQSGARPPLFCIHPIGGNVLGFQALASRLGPEQPVYGLQARGLDGRQTPHHSIEDMAVDYLASIRELVRRGPLLIAGYSAGGLVALEMARQLLAASQISGAKEPRVFLVLLDCCIAKKSSGPGPIRRLSKLLNMPRPERVASLRRNVHAFWTDAVMRLQIGKFRVLRRLGIATAKLRSVDHAFALAVGDYHARPVRCDALLFRADEGDGANVDDQTMGWGPLISGRLTVHRVQAGHVTMLQDPCAGELAARLETDIGRFLA